MRTQCNAFFFYQRFKIDELNDKIHQYQQNSLLLDSKLLPSHQPTKSNQSKVKFPLPHRVAYCIGLLISSSDK